ncbi:hypothetical protein Tco_0722034 [Tanacetum coccineum]
MQETLPLDLISDPTETTSPQPLNSQPSTPTSPKPTPTEINIQVPQDNEALQKDDTKRKIPKASTQKTLFGDDPKPDPTEGSKKKKHNT